MSRLLGFRLTGGIQKAELIPTIILPSSRRCRDSVRLVGMALPAAAEEPDAAASRACLIERPAENLVAIAYA